MEELMTRMGVIVGEGRYLLAGDLLQAFLPLLYVGEGLEAAGDDEAGIDFLAGLSLGGKGRCRVLCCAICLWAEPNRVTDRPISIR